MAVTFDDAYLSVLELAKPIMDRLGLVGTVFVPTDYPERDEPMAWPGIDHWVGGPHEAELRPMNWEQLRRLAEEGWEIGSHTCSHPHLTELDIDSLDRELIVSRTECERHLGRPCLTVAYPYGDYDERVAAAAGRAGYQAACTLPARFHEARPLEWPRVGVYHTDDDRRFRLKVSPLLRRLRSSRAWSAVDGAGGALEARRLGGAGGVTRRLPSSPAAYFPIRTRSTFERPTPGTYARSLSLLEWRRTRVIPNPRARRPTLPSCGFET